MLLDNKYTKDNGLILLSDEGRDLEQMATFENTFSLADLLTMLRETLSAIQALHNLGYVHCDIKVENICAKRIAKKLLKFTLIDMGIASNFNITISPKK